LPAWFKLNAGRRPWVYCYDENRTSELISAVLRNR
jgi:hypothetical protein